MKTLKQQLQEATKLNGRYFLTHTEIIEIVKKWLTQKRQENIEALKGLPPSLARGFLNCATYQIDEFLEELK